MNDRAFAALLVELLRSDNESLAIFNGEVRDAIPYDELGVLTNNAGLVVRMDDGSEFQITVVRSRGPRR